MSPRQDRVLREPGAGLGAEAAAARLWLGLRERPGREAEGAGPRMRMEDGAQILKEESSEDGVWVGIEGHVGDSNGG